MLYTPTIQQIAVDASHVFAFRVTGEVVKEDLQAMAEVMNAAFDRYDTVSMLLLFDHFEGAEWGAGFDFQTVTSQFRSLAKVEKYAVVGAPGVAATMITVMDKLIPTDARAFAADEAAQAWSFVGTYPVGGV